MLHEGKSCGCQREIGMSKAKTPHYCEHRNLLVYVHGLGSKAKSNGGRSTPKQGRGFAASPAQQKKVRDLPCIVCGRDRHEGVEIHAAHVYPRRFQSCECPGGVVPLCGEHHALYDDQNQPFDLLRHLVTRGYHAELVHAVAVHQVPIRELLDQVTGVKWAPVSEAVAA